MRSEICPQSPSGDLAVFFLGLKGQNGMRLCQDGKPDTGKLYATICLCTSGRVVDDIGATAY